MTDTQRLEYLWRNGFLSPGEGRPSFLPRRTLDELREVIDAEIENETSKEVLALICICGHFADRHAGLHKSRTACLRCGCRNFRAVKWVLEAAAAELEAVRYAARQP